MLVLALDSSATASVALARVHGSEAGASFEILARYESEDTRSHAEVMGPYARAALQDAGVRGEDLDAILTGTGPGPFTGLRAGIVTARALGFAWSVPVYGMMSLTALAERAVSGAAAEEENVERAFASADLIEDAELLVLSDARRREVYSARYRVNAEGYSLVDGPNVCPASEILPGGILLRLRLRRRPVLRNSRRARLDHRRFCPSGSPPRRVPGCRRGTPGRREPERGHLRPVPARLGRKGPRRNARPPAEAGRTGSCTDCRAEGELNERYRKYRARRPGTE